MSLLDDFDSNAIPNDHPHPGSGIYVSPAIVLRHTGSVGASLLLWTLGVLLAMCGLMVFLELGLSVPKFQLPESPNDPPREGERPFVNVPRNGGAKNYVSSQIECMMSRPASDSASSSTYITTRESAPLACTALFLSFWETEQEMLS